MFYTGDQDKVQCYFCEVVIGQWAQSDEPAQEHLMWSPNCPLMNNRTTINRPIEKPEQPTRKTFTVRKVIETTVEYCLKPQKNNDKLCKICYDAEYNIVFLPCGHVVTCKKCSIAIFKCPICREFILEAKQIYFS